MGAPSGDVRDIQTAEALATPERTHKNPESRTLKTHPLKSECFGMTPRWIESGGSVDTQRLEEDFALPRH